MNCALANVTKDKVDKGNGNEERETTAGMPHGAVGDLLGFSFNLYVRMNARSATNAIDSYTPLHTTVRGVRKKLDWLSVSRGRGRSSPLAKQEGEHQAASTTSNTIPIGVNIKIPTMKAKDNMAMRMYVRKAATKLIGCGGHPMDAERKYVKEVVTGMPTVIGPWETVPIYLNNVMTTAALLPISLREPATAPNCSGASPAAATEMRESHMSKSAPAEAMWMVSERMSTTIDEHNAVAKGKVGWKSIRRRPRARSRTRGPGKARLQNSSIGIPRKARSALVRRAVKDIVDANLKWTGTQPNAAAAAIIHLHGTATPM